MVTLAWVVTLVSFFWFTRFSLGVESQDVDLGENIPKPWDFTLRDYCQYLYDTVWYDLWYNSLECDGIMYDLLRGLNNVGDLLPFALPYTDYVVILIPTHSNATCFTTQDSNGACQSITTVVVMPERNGLDRSLVGHSTV